MKDFIPGQIQRWPLKSGGSSLVRLMETVPSDSLNLIPQDP